MFYYYGRKFIAAKYYHTPEYNTIIEPFAGSAAYSLHGENWNRDVKINDINPVVVTIWDYLIHHATIKDIMALPDVTAGEDIRKHTQLEIAERYIIGFAINPGSIAPRNIVTKFSRWPANKKYIIDNLHKVKHWKLSNISFNNINTAIRATWFVDPPYQKMGYAYPFGIDYTVYVEWVNKLVGQIICCENADADYLPFVPLFSLKSAGKKRNVEAVYYRDS